MSDRMNKQTGKFNTRSKPPKVQSVPSVNNMRDRTNNLSGKYNTKSKPPKVQSVPSVNNTEGHQITDKDSIVKTSWDGSDGFVLQPSRRRAEVPDAGRIVVAMNKRGIVANVRKGDILLAIEGEQVPPEAVYKEVLTKIIKSPKPIHLTFHRVQYAPTSQFRSASKCALLHDIAQLSRELVALHSRCENAQTRAHELVPLQRERGEELQKLQYEMEQLRNLRAKGYPETKLVQASTTSIDEATKSLKYLIRQVRKLRTDRLAIRKDHDLARFARLGVQSELQTLAEAQKDINTKANDLLQVAGNASSPHAILEGATSADGDSPFHSFPSESFNMNSDKVSECTQTNRSPKDGISDDTDVYREPSKSSEQSSRSEVQSEEPNSVNDTSKHVSTSHETPRIRDELLSPSSSSQHNGWGAEQHTLLRAFETARIQLATAFAELKHIRVTYSPAFDASTSSTEAFHGEAELDMVIHGMNRSVRDSIVNIGDHLYQYSLKYWFLQRGLPERKLTSTQQVSNWLRLPHLKNLHEFVYDVTRSHEADLRALRLAYSSMLLELGGLTTLYNTMATKLSAHKNTLRAKPEKDECTPEPSKISSHSSNGSDIVQNNQKTTHRTHSSVPSYSFNDYSASKTVASDIENLSTDSESGLHGMIATRAPSSRNPFAAPSRDTNERSPRTSTSSSQSHLNMQEDVSNPNSTQFTHVTNNSNKNPFSSTSGTAAEHRQPIAHSRTRSHSLCSDDVDAWANSDED